MNYRNKIYYGISETKFNSRYANHQKIFKNRNYKTDTELSNKICKLKEQNKKCGYIVGNSRDIYIICTTHQQNDACCLNEKLAIALHKEGNILNKHTKITSKCRHSIKYNLANYDTKD